MSKAQISEAVQHPCQEPRNIPAHAPVLAKVPGTPQCKDLSLLRSPCSPDPRDKHLC